MTNNYIFRDFENEPNAITYVPGSFHKNRIDNEESKDIKIIANMNGGLTSD